MAPKDANPASRAPCVSRERADAAPGAEWLRRVLALALAAALGACGGKPAAPAHPGKAVYLRYCFSCHQAGLAGAPKLGEGEDWESRVAKGTPAMLANVKAGMTPGMPPRGACAGCDDETLAAAVDYMVSELR